MLYALIDLVLVYFYFLELLVVKCAGDDLGCDACKVSGTLAKLVGDWGGFVGGDGLFLDFAGELGGLSCRGVVQVDSLLALLARLAVVLVELVLGRLLLKCVGLDGEARVDLLLAAALVVGQVEGCVVWLSLQNVCAVVVDYVCLVGRFIEVVWLVCGLARLRRVWLRVDSSLGSPIVLVGFLGEADLQRALVVALAPLVWHLAEQGVALILLAEAV